MEGDDSEEEEDAVEDCEYMPAEFKCLITTMPISKPVMAIDGPTYEARAIQRWFVSNGNATSPVTVKVLGSKHLIKNHAPAKLIRDWASLTKAKESDAPKSKRMRRMKYSRCYVFECSLPFSRVCFVLEYCSVECVECRRTLAWVAVLQKHTKRLVRTALWAHALAPSPTHPPSTRFLLLPLSRVARG